MLGYLKNLVDDTAGVTSVEYGLIGALLVVTAMGSLTALGTSLADIFLAVKSAVDGVLVK
jgi:Flp pilus assembly pilin Flp